MPPDDDGVQPCPCDCCADALERLKFDRDLMYACLCFDYPPDEQCDCSFCVATIRRWLG